MLMLDGLAGGVGWHMGVGCLVCGASADFASLVGLRPKPAGRDVDCDVSKHVLGCMPVMLCVDLSRVVLYD
jgi:hypothetical protein